MHIGHFLCNHEISWRRQDGETSQIFPFLGWLNHPTAEDWELQVAIGGKKNATTLWMQIFVVRSQLFLAFMIISYCMFFGVVFFHIVPPCNVEKPLFFSPIFGRLLEAMKEAGYDVGELPEDGGWSEKDPAKWFGFGTPKDYTPLIKRPFINYCFFHLISTLVFCKMAISQNKKWIAMLAVSFFYNLCYTCDGEQQNSYVSCLPSMLEILKVVKW